MITELKRTPITWNGEDGWEILVIDDFPIDVFACEFCMYSEWNDWSGNGLPCSIVHKCGSDPNTFFIFKKS